MKSENFTYLNKNELQKKLEETKRNFEVQKIMAEFIQEMAKKGHKKIDKRIETELQKFLAERKIEYKYTYYCNDNKKYGDTTLFDIELSVFFENYNGCANRISIIKGFDERTNGGFYDNLLEANQWATIENIKKNEKETLKEYENAFENLRIYNKKLEELAELRDSFGYLAK